MERRTFVKTAGASGIIILLPSSVAGCGDKQLEALRPWDISSDLSENTDIRLKLVSYALLAPSAHNKQPWLVDLRGEGIDLYIDPKRLLPQTDPPARQIMISQGAFIEILSPCRFLFWIPNKYYALPQRRRSIGPDRQHSGCAYILN